MVWGSKGEHDGGGSGELLCILGRLGRAFMQKRRGIGMHARPEGDNTTVMTHLHLQY